MNLKLIYRLVLTGTFFIGFLFTTLAQTKPSIHFIFSTNPINDSLQSLVVKAIIPKGTKLFSVKKSISAEGFVSNLVLDSSSNKFLSTGDTINEKGNLIKEKQVDGSEYLLFADSVQFTYILHVSTPTGTNIKGSFIWLSKNGDNFPSGEEKFSLSIKPSTSRISNLPKQMEMSILSTFLIALLAGLVAVFTPCVFPLIPVTVSFFLKRSGSRQEGVRNAVIYSLSIISIYTIPTLILTLIFGNSVLYTISTSAVANILFFVIFIIFSISFFGAFELNLPNSWANKADEQAGKSGVVGIFFMALTLTIVSFSCTGPLVGTLLGQTSNQGIALAPVIGMLGFGLGLALPFSLMAFFPSMLHALPKSGGWLNSVKVAFGFIELALGMKFLSNVDLIYHWHLLDRDVFLVIWIVVFCLLGSYLLGKLKFSHDSDLKYISVPRLFLAIAAYCFALFMVPGLWGAPLKQLSGFIPPVTTQDFNLEDLKYTINNNTQNTSSTGNTLQPKKYIDKLKVPLGLTAYFDLNEGMQAAKELNKPVMLDFTGHSCPNCRKMEEQVWRNEVVLKKIKEDFILISLYVDEPTELPVSEQYTTAEGKKIVTVGEKNLDYELTKFGFNAQPLYMFLDQKGNPLSNVKYGYDSDIDKFIKHLNTVKEAFERVK